MGEIGAGVKEGSGEGKVFVTAGCICHRVSIHAGYVRSLLVQGATLVYRDYLVVAGSWS